MYAQAEQPDKPNDRRKALALAMQMRGLIDQMERMLDVQVHSIRQQLDDCTRVAGSDPEIAIAIRGLSGFMAGAIAFRAVLAEFGPCFTRRLDSPAE